MVCLIFFSVIGIYINHFVEKQRNLYNDNSKIITEDNTSSYLIKICKTDNIKSKLKFNFTGIDTIWILDVKEDTTICLDYKCNITKGNFKAVITTPENEIINIFENSSK